MTDLRDDKAKGIKLPLLDRRLRGAAEMAGAFEAFADIGADHGQLSAVLLSESSLRRAVVSDISEKALSRARERLKLHGLLERAVLCRADGLHALEGLPFEVQVVFILGMGGETIRSILMDGAELLHRATLVLGAHTEIELLRQTLCDLGYRITQERFLTENNHHYVLIRADFSEQKVLYTPKEIFLGPVLMRKPCKEWVDRLEHRAEILRGETRAMTASRLPPQKEAELLQKRRELEWISEIIWKYTEEKDNAGE